MTQYAKESAPMADEAPSPAKYRSLIRALRRRKKDRAGLVESRYYRWIAGELPDLIRMLVEDREIAEAVHEDAIRYELANEKDDEAPDA